MYTWLWYLILHIFLASKETVVLRCWESEKKKLVLSKELIKVEMPP